MSIFKRKQFRQEASLTSELRRVVEKMQPVFDITSSLICFSFLFFLLRSTKSKKQKLLNTSESEHLNTEKVEQIKWSDGFDEKEANENRDDVWQKASSLHWQLQMTEKKKKLARVRFEIKIHETCGKEVSTERRTINFDLQK